MSFFDQIELNNPFDILGIDEDDEINEDEIKDKFREKVLKAHPDRGGTNDAVIAVLEARDVLLDKNKREKYLKELEKKTKLPDKVKDELDLNDDGIITENEISEAQFNTNLINGLYFTNPYLADLLNYNPPVHILKPTIEPNTDLENQIKLVQRGVGEYNLDLNAFNLSF